MFFVPTLPDLAALLRRTASLSQALPNQAVRDYHAAVVQAVETMSAEARGTEVERLVRQRVGQARYRDALLTYWGGSCAVTGVAVTEALRASHAKPWAECADDAERLDAFNGFLLVANLDALFDRFLISFDDAGHLLTSTRLSQSDLPGLGIHSGMTLRWLASFLSASLNSSSLTVRVVLRTDWMAAFCTMSSSSACLSSASFTACGSACGLGCCLACLLWFLACGCSFCPLF